MPLHVSTIDGEECLICLKSYLGSYNVKALMLPVAILPAAGILLAFGNAMHNEQLVHLAPWLNHPVFVAISSVMEASGQVVLTIYHYYLQSEQHLV